MEVQRLVDKFSGGAESYPGQNDYSLQNYLSLVSFKKIIFLCAGKK
jgi:hypothetical protein